MPLRSTAVAALGAAALVAAAPVRADLDIATRQKVFDRVWTTVRDKHWDPTLGGIDWAAVRKKYAPQINAARSDTEYYRLLQAMLGELKQSHFNIIPPDTYVAADKSAKAGGRGETGLTVSLVDGDAVVTAVEPGSPAAAAGLRAGFALSAVDGERLAPLLERIRARNLRPGEEQVEVRMLLRHLLSGPVGARAQIVYRDGDDREATVSLARVAPRGQMVEVMNLPPLPVLTEKRTLPGGYGYVRFNIFLMQPARAQVEAAIFGFKKAPGLVIDLRGNPGGMGAMAQPIAGYLMPAGKEGISLGSMKQRQMTIRFNVNPQPPHYAGPVAILVDEMSLSTSEVLAGGLQELGRAAIVGRTTGGMVLPSLIESVGGGVRLQYAVADFKTPRGVLLEGRGVIPDVPVALSRKALLASPDPILDAAIDYLKTKKANL